MSFLPFDINPYIAGHEVEFKFYEYGPNLQKSSSQSSSSSNKPISVNRFNNFLQYLTTLNPHPEITLTTVEIYPAYRKITLPNKQVYYEEKNNVLFKHLEDFPIKLTISTEKKLSLQEVKQIQTPSTPSLKRMLYRRSFNFTQYKFDLTIVNPYTSATAYEIELEILQPLNNLNDLLIHFLRILYQTANLYTTQEIAALNQAYRQTFQNNLTIEGNLYKARNLHYKDMVYGGLVGNNRTSYMVSFKADGERKVLIINSVGLWLITDHEYNLVIRANFNEFLGDYLGIILEGELLPLENNYNPELKGYQYIFYLYDALYKGKDDYRIYAYDIRWKLCDMFAKALRERINQKMIWIGTKNNYHLGSVEKFYSDMNLMLDNVVTNLVSFKQDGLIFTPLNTNYYGGEAIKSDFERDVNLNLIGSVGASEDEQNIKISSENQEKLSKISSKKPENISKTSSISPYNRHDKLALNQRVLSQYADVCKWKPANLLTIDFLWLNKDLYVSGLDNKLVKFSAVAPDYLTFLNSSSSPLTLDPKIYPNNTVIEFAWNAQIKQFVPHRARLDKEYPNRIDFALDNWSLIQRPIDQKTLRGTDLNLMRRYHNRIKRDLFLKKYEGKTLLDIGSGRGGDVEKWKYAGFAKIIAVEPNPEHIAELRQRIKMAGIEEKVYILQARGEDHVLIKQAVEQFFGERKAEVISFMLSLSFFWQTETNLISLFKTIFDCLHQYGEIIFLTIDGFTIKEKYAQLNSVIPQNTLEMLRQAYAFIYDHQKQEVFIDIHDSIVQEQTEWLVFLDDLRLSLDLINLEKKYYLKADKELFLSKDEKDLSQFYTYGNYTRREVGREKIEKVYYKLKEMLFNIEIENGGIPRWLEILKEWQKEEIGKITVPKISGEISRGLEQVQQVQQVQLIEPSQKILTPPRISPVQHQIQLPSYFKTYALIPNDLIPNLIRIDTIGEGSCFIHAFFQAYSEAYRNADDKLDFAKKARRDLAFLLQYQDPARPNYPIYDRYQFRNLAMLDNMYSLPGMMQHLNSNTYLGDEIYKLISDLYNVNLLIFYKTGEKITIPAYISYPTYQKTILFYYLQAEQHYETVGIIREGKILTLFNKDDVDVKKLISIIEK